MKYSINTSIVIDATPQVVWGILTDFQNYPSWNPFIKSLRGNVQVGERINAQIQQMKFKPTVLSFEAKKEFSWVGHLLFPRVFDGTHSFQLIANATGGTTFIHKESFRGILVPLMKKKLRTEIADGFHAMNQALKEKAEATL